MIPDDSCPEPWIDPIVEEFRLAGAKLAKDAGYDLHTLCERLRAAECQHPERFEVPGERTLSASS